MLSGLATRDRLGVSDRQHRAVLAIDERKEVLRELQRREAVFHNADYGCGQPAVRGRRKGTRARPVGRWLR